MSIDWSIWGQPLGMLGLASVVGAGLAAMSATKDATKDTSSRGGQTQRNDLESTRQEVKNALRQLELDKDKLDPKDYAQERQALLTRGAAAMRALDGLGATPPAAPSALAAPADTGPLNQLQALLNELGSENFQAGLAYLKAMRPLALSSVTVAGFEQVQPPAPDHAQQAVERLQDLLNDLGAEPFQTGLGFLKLQRAIALGAVTVQGLDLSAPAPTAPPSVPNIPTPVALPPVEEPAMAPQYQGALWMFAAVVMVSSLIWFAQGDSQERRDGASMTGNQDLGMAEQEGPPPMPPQMQSAAADLEQQLQASPDDMDLLNNLVQLYLSAGDPGKAMEFNNHALEVDPTHPDTRVHKAILQAMVGMDEQARLGLDAVIKDFPEHPMAWTYKGLLLLDMGDREGAVAALEKAVELQPDNHALRQAMERAKNGEPLNPGAGGRPQRPPQGAPPSGPVEVVVSGTISLDPSVKLSGQQLVFISLRDPAGGPPLAAVKLPTSSFPLDFKVTTADALSMGGAPRPFPAQMNLSVRVDVDGDGNAMTKSPTDPAAMLGDTAKGSTGLQVTLK